jgi:GNAT superfamily N-acetyltransferase
MLVRPVTAEELDVFASGRGRLPDLSQLTTKLWASGASRPEWCWLVCAGDRVLARVGVRVIEDPAVVPAFGYAGSYAGIEPDLLAVAWSRVPYTLGLFALGYESTATGVELVREMLRRLDLPAGTVIEARTNPEVHADPAGRCQILTAAGFALFQEKQGFTWYADTQSPVAGGELRLAPFPQAGADRFLAVMAEAGADTLDRNDRFYYGRCGPRGWARVMLGYLVPAEEATWCVAYDEAGDEVGFFAVSAFPEPGTATVTHIGVVPRQRGQGHGRRLLAAATAAAAGAGFGAMLCDVDVENRPMTDAMRAVGYRDDQRPWHVWHHRVTI